jgi:tetratricopeptide (TPR) repeat protein
MKVFLLALLCTISFSASAQWWSFKKHKRYPMLAEVKYAPFRMPAAKLMNTNVKRVTLGMTTYGLTLSERSVMKTAQHQMRFRQYEDASYSFNELAKIYVQQGKLSEAKWFYLQSNNLSRQQNNDRLTIANLIELANVKSTIGDFALAQQDLDEARDMATAHNWQDDVLSVKKHMDGLQRSKLAYVKPEAGLAGTTTL